MCDIVELNVIGHVDNGEEETDYVTPTTSQNEENEYSTLAETVKNPVHHVATSQHEHGCASSNRQSDESSLRKLKVFGVVLLVMVLISSATTGTLIYMLMKRAETAEQKSVDLQVEVSLLKAKSETFTNTERILQPEREKNATNSYNQTLDTRLTYLEDGLDCDWGNWTAYSSCSATCGEGIRYRQRSCEGPDPKWFPGKEIDIQSCIMMSCPEDGQWTDWLQWTSCSVSCGSGQTTRQRLCLNPKHFNGGRSCTGSSSEHATCQAASCPVNGGWGDWSSVSACSYSCGGGTQSRHRDCDNPSPANGGSNCSGSREETTACDTGLCPVDGQWTDWLQWTSCSVSCGFGQMTRQRLCLNPKPLNGGRSCTGSSSEYATCQTASCPVNGGWSSWSSWSSCTKSCNTGQRHRDRTCSDPAPVGSGRVCIGQTDELSNCNESPCPVDGQWTDWLQWSGCSVSCGSGQMTRQRLCLNPKPSNGGQSCVGPSSKQSTCETANCPVNGGWSSWSSWSTCTKSCNTGQKHRNRTCSNPAPVWSGRACIGQTDELSNCNESPCPGIKSAFTFSNPAAGPTNGTIKFTRVVTNIGGHYNTATGKFTCQYPGIYVFLLHILKNTGANSAFCYIKMNDSNKMFVQSYTGISNAAGNYGASNSVILHLGSGDIVDLDGCSSVDTFWTSWQTSFSGFLLKED